MQLSAVFTFCGILFAAFADITSAQATGAPLVYEDDKLESNSFLDNQLQNEAHFDWRSESMLDDKEQLQLQSDDNTAQIQSMFDSHSYMDDTDKQQLQSDYMEDVNELLLQNEYTENADQVQLLNDYMEDAELQYMEGANKLLLQNEYMDSAETPQLQSEYMNDIGEGLQMEDAVLQWLEQQLMVERARHADTPGCPIDPGITIPKVTPGTPSKSFPTCAAFVMDLTGSMTEEIGAIKQVLSNFLTSQLHASNEYCYVFVKVIGPGQSKLIIQ